MAPEIINQESYDYKPDVWSAMVVVYVLFTGDMPFYGDTLSELHEEIKYKDIVKEINENTWWNKVSP